MKFPSLLGWQPDWPLGLASPLGRRLLLLLPPGAALMILLLPAALMILMPAALMILLLPAAVRVLGHFLYPSNSHKPQLLTRGLSR